MESDDLTVVGRLIQTLAEAILKALDSIAVLVLRITRRLETADRKSLADLWSIIMDEK